MTNVASLAAHRNHHPHRGQVFWLDIPGVGANHRCAVTPVIE